MSLVNPSGAAVSGTLVDDFRGPPRAAGAVILLEAIVGLTALSGGLTLAFSPYGSAAKLPMSLLEHSGFSSYLVPGMLLAFVVGGLNLTAAAMTLRKSAYAALLSALAGGALVLFIVVELMLTRTFHPLQLVMLALGLAIVRLSLPERTRRS